ncbi:MAG: ribulose-phosphate 3-epimerase [Nitrospirae bacterium]|nr:ribulose-phosphate 3-epimerase [Nitrospirota bacterium]
MNRPGKIAPSIAAGDYLRMGDELRAVTEAGADYIHVDVMDGHFVPNLTFGPEVISYIKKGTPLPLDVHLMIENAEDTFADYISAGASIVTVHIEAVRHLHRLIHEMKRRNVKVGVAINPSTPVETLAEILPDLDLVNVMSVNPGFYGQAFIPGTLDKVARLRRLAAGRGEALEIEVDGGIKLDNIAPVAAAGADVFVSGSGVFKNPPYAATIRKMRDALRPR